MSSDDSSLPPIDVPPLDPPVIDGGWVRPSGRLRSEPRWGHQDGLQVGLSPLPGPRGLLRIFAPYLGHEAERLVNFIAVEPIPTGQQQRGLSELERSSIDGQNGKIFGSADALGEPGGDAPARGVVTVDNGVEHLQVYVPVERFDNGASVCVRISFRADRPHEVGLAAYTLEDSVPLEACVLSATMGNFARLRLLHLAGRVVAARELWPDYDGIHFTEHAAFGLGELERNAERDALVTAEPDEAAPHTAVYQEGTHEHWKWVGTRAAQGWRAEQPDAGLRAQVNGRVVYWAGQSPIPGGVAFENFELVEPFRQGREFVFSVEPIR